MYCTKCGKETSDGASFCPYCGAVIEQAAPEKVPEPTPERIPAPAMNTVKNVAPAQAPVVSIENQNEELPVYKRKNKGAFLVGFIPVIVAIFKAMYAGLALVMMAPR